jgi:hypothetical protein
MLSKFGYCKVSISPVRSENKDLAEIVTQLLFGEIIHIEEISGSWCKIITFSDNYSGWIDVKHFLPLTQKELNRWQDGLSYENSIFRTLVTPWGKQRIVKGSFVPFNSKEEFKIGNDSFNFIEPAISLTPTSAYELAIEYLNTPYLWGGKSPFGIDCSGLTQTVFRFFEKNLPRDASQQIEHGLEVDFEDILEGDIAFFHNKEGKIIHVGILNGDGKIIHASGCVRIDSFTKEGIIHSESGFLTHNLNRIKRI